MFTLVFISCIAGFQCEKTEHPIKFDTVVQCIQQGNRIVMNELPKTWGPHTDSINFKLAGDGTVVFNDTLTNETITFVCAGKK